MRSKPSVTAMSEHPHGAAPVSQPTFCPHSPAVRASAPRARHLNTGNSEDIVERLLAGELHQPLFDSPSTEVRVVHLYNDDLSLVVAPSHPFAAKGR